MKRGLLVLLVTVALATAALADPALFDIRTFAGIPRADEVTGPCLLVAGKPGLDLAHPSPTWFPILFARQQTRAAIRCRFDWYADVYR